jgi:hypothetical protein
VTLQSNTPNHGLALHGIASRNYGSRNISSQYGNTWGAISGIWRPSTNVLYCADEGWEYDVRRLRTNAKRSALCDADWLDMQRIILCSTRAAFRDIAGAQKTRGYVRLCCSDAVKCAGGSHWFRAKIAVMKCRANWKSLMLRSPMRLLATRLAIKTAANSKTGVASQPNRLQQRRSPKCHSLYQRSSQPA